MVAVNDCGAPAAFGGTVTVTVPAPEPVAGVSESAALDEAVHDEGEHPADDGVTLTTVEPPVDAKLAVDGEIPNVHGVLVGVGSGVAGALVRDDPLHPSITKRLSAAATEHDRFMARGSHVAVVRIACITRPLRRLSAPSSQA
jgi:hypothetical protein